MPVMKLFSREQLENSPSRRDSYSAAKEAKMRRQYCHLLADAGMRLQVPQLVIATSVIFCHRYFAVKSMSRNDSFVVAMACLHLAGKVEECPRQIKSVLEKCLKCRYEKKDPAELDSILNNKLRLDELKEAVLTAERALLYTLGFDFAIGHPYQPLLQLISDLGLELKHPGLSQKAWNIVNDSLRTTLGVQYAAEHLAVAFLHLALKLTRGAGQPADPKTGAVWWHGRIAEADLQDIVFQLLALYEEQGTATGRAHKAGQPKSEDAGLRAAAA